MNDIPNGYFRDEDGMLRQSPAPTPEPSPAVVSFIPELSDDELRKLSREKLSMALQAINPVTQPAMTKALCAELMDRLDGKPGQAITMDANVRTVTVNAKIEFIKPNVVIDQEQNTQVIDNKQ